jgi:HSP90 family molecular chaperone
MQPDRCRKAFFFPNMCSVNSDRLMKAQTLGDTSSLEFMRGRRIFEINPDHPIIKDLNVRFSFTALFVKGSCI